MSKKLILILLATSIFTGCASVPMESSEQSTASKQFFGGALKKDIWIDGKCIGESAPNTFFFEKLIGGKEYKVSTESEFSPNDLLVKVESGKNYFVQQYIKMGLIVGGAGLKLVDEEKGKEAVQKLNLASKGNCSRQLTK